MKMATKWIKKLTVWIVAVMFERHRPANPIIREGLIGIQHNGVSLSDIDIEAVNSKWNMIDAINLFIHFSKKLFG